MPELIFDTNVLSNFALAGQLALLREIYPTSANCTGYVFSEVHRGVRLGHEGLMALAAALACALVRAVAGAPSSPATPAAAGR